MNTETPEIVEDDIETEEPATDDNDESTQKQQNPLALSDEEIMAMGDPADSVSEPEQPDEPAVEPSDAPEEEDDAGDNAEPEETPDTPAEEDSEGKEPERDIAAEHAKLFAPLKAGGQTIELKSVDEIISLMQKGADYHRKTEELSAHRKTLKTLEKAGIKPENLNYLIELHNKNPQAIAKLIAESGVDPFELDTDSDETKNYKPQEHSVSDSDIQLDEVLDRLKTTPTWNQLIEVVGEKWDDQSRQAVATDTELLEAINTHMENGMYPLIAKEMNRQRALGQLRGLNDLTAYQQVGRAIDDQGGFAHLITDEQRAEWARMHGHTPPPPIAVPPKQGSSDPNLDAKRRAASPTKAASKMQKKTSNQQNPLALSDEAFEKQFSSSLQ